MKTWIWSFVVVCCLVSCTEKPLQRVTQSIPQPWDEESISFEITAKDTVATYTLIANIEHDPDFQYENFYTEITTQFPSSEELKSSISFDLADDIGQWLGSCSSTKCNVSILLKKQFKFKELGPHVFRFNNFSREPLNGIHGITLELWPSASIK